MDVASTNKVLNSWGLDLQLHADRSRYPSLSNIQTFDYLTNVDGTAYWN